MNRPKLKKYTANKKIYFPEEFLPLLEKYTEALEDYCDYLESKVNKNDALHSVSNREAICKKCQKEMIIDMMNEQVYCDDCGDWAGGKCDNLDCKHK